MLEISLPVTSMTAICAALILLVLTWKVIMLRRKDGVVLGDTGDRVLTKAIRGQANAAEQLPMALILMGLAELQGAYGVALTALAAILLIGRGMHAAYFGIHGLTWRLRFYGMFLTLIAQGGLIILLGLTLL
ncbi:MAPEG family protein [Cognatiyoonia sp. IB215182]|uniref:MAPEG family protein n=1 Tax=Cognatiyoonia sp. IB215182 TaxID=3097353 RepID=UPI002A11D5B3|nr:MAPEG family protein [Cognatiyoonia sp. IB215182]MDX8351051.1 MAPEG family protein [Cognatiyoonia sp. IB215182]